MNSNAHHVLSLIVHSAVVDRIHLRSHRCSRIISSASNRLAMLTGCLAIGCAPEGESESIDDETMAGPSDASGGTMEPMDPPEESIAAWTIFVYGHGDHNLSPSLAEDIFEMTEATLTEDINVIVMADWDASQEDYPSGTEWYRFSGGGAGELEPFEVVPEQDLDDPQVLYDSIVRAYSDAPAENYGLILWDHGGAWSGGFGGDTQDGTSDGFPTAAPDIAITIDQALEDVGIEQLRFLAFDTCLMAGAEILAEFASLTELYIANAELDYGPGWNYRATFSALADEPEMDMQTFATVETEVWAEHHNEDPIDVLLRSHVAIDTALATDFFDAYRAFTTAYVNGSQMSALDIGRAAYFSLPGYDASGIETLADTPELRDAGGFLEEMERSTDPTIADAARTALDALDSMVLAWNNGTLRDQVVQYGLHIALPSAKAIPDMEDAYRELAPAWVEATGWDAGLVKLATLADDAAPVFMTEFDEDTYRLVFSTEEADVAEADITVATTDPEDPDLTVVLGLVGTTVVSAGSGYEFTWDGKVLAIGDGIAESERVYVFPFARVGQQYEGRAPVLGIPGILVDEGVEYEVILPFQSTDETVSLIVVFDEYGSAVYSTAEAIGATFIPLTVAVDTSTDEVVVFDGRPIEIGGSGVLELTAVDAPEGDYSLYTTMFDVWGNTASVGDRFSFP